MRRIELEGAGHERCLAAGMDGYVAKPLDRQKLIDEIENALPAHRARKTPVSAA